MQPDFPDRDRDPIAEIIKSLVEKLLHGTCCASLEHNLRVARNTSVAESLHVAPGLRRAPHVEAENHFLKHAHPLIAGTSDEREFLILFSDHLLPNYVRNLFSGSPLSYTQHGEDVYYDTLLKLTRRFDRSFDWQNCFKFRAYVKKAAISVFQDLWNRIFGRPPEPSPARAPHIPYSNEDQNRYLCEIRKVREASETAVGSESTRLEIELWIEKYLKDLSNETIANRNYPRRSANYRPQLVSRTIARMRRRFASSFVELAAKDLVDALEDRYTNHPRCLGIQIELAGAILAEAGRLPSGATGHRGRRTS